MISCMSEAFLSETLRNIIQQKTVCKMFSGRAVKTQLQVVLFAATEDF